MAGKSFADYIRKWEMLNNGLKPMLPDLPHLAPEQAELEQLINEAKMLDDQQKQLRGKAQDTTKQRRAAQLKGFDLHERLAVQLKGKLGLRNQNLVGLGLRPRKTPKSRQSKPPETPQPAPQPHVPGTPSPVPAPK